MKNIVASNLKMNLLSINEREAYLKRLGALLAGKKFTDTEIVLCAPFVHLEGFKKWKNKKVKRGAQNMFFEDKGSFTGEISPVMLKNFDCEYVILGHSERRKYIQESNQDVNLKVISALKNGIKPILCVGEDADQKRDGTDIVVEQLQDCLNGVSKGKIENVIICYEPVWAISSNNPDHLPTTNEVMSARLLIKKFLVAEYGAKITEKVKIIYGGSVAPDNAGTICVDSGMDGALVGKESLTPSSLVKIVEIIDGKPKT
ncbi:MAG: triose-phosphate isomerase [Candidatus Moranbacteria bacterium]|nr:triose-phosphate isomerase [Candidatus Moranbacteria bacterium]MDZ4385438.1 triose-phosphate isomerase [Candidatus Moranbacteria bacterium]